MTDDRPLADPPHDPKDTDMPTTRISILGAGRVGAGLARGFAAAGHSVTLGVRDPAGPHTEWSDVGIAVTDAVTAVRSADLVVNATPGDSSLDRLTSLRSDLAGRILLDVSNATVRTSDGLPGGLLYPDGSLGERLQAVLPDTRVVKSLNTMLFSVMTDPAALAAPPSAFLSGNDADAKSITRKLLHDLGWQDDWIVDLGPIATASGTEAMALIVPSLLHAFGFVPFALSVAR